MSRGSRGARQTDRRAGRCRNCGGPLGRRAARRYGEVVPTALILVGSVLVCRMVGVLLIPLGLLLWSRTREDDACPACGES